MATKKAKKKRLRSQSKRSKAFVEYKVPSGIFPWEYQIVLHETGRKK